MVAAAPVAAVAAASAASTAAAAGTATVIGTGLSAGVFSATAATTATAVGGGVAGGLSLASALQGGLAIISAASSILGGFAAKDAADAQSEQAEFDADRVRVEGLQEEARIAEETNLVLGQHAAELAFSGIAPGGVTQAVLSKSAAEAKITREQFRAQEARRRTSARTARSRGRSALFGGIAGAAQAGLSFGLQRAET